MDVTTKRKNLRAKIVPSNCPWCPGTLDWEILDRNGKTIVHSGHGYRRLENAMTAARAAVVDVLETRSASIERDGDEVVDCAECGDPARSRFRGAPGGGSYYVECDSCGTRASFP